VGLRIEKKTSIIYTKKIIIAALLPIKILSIILEHFGRFFFRDGGILLFSYLPLGAFGTMPSFEDLETQILI
jgi:hypothetical protein